MSVHFMLAPDAQSGAIIRRRFATTSALNVKVGTFDVLLDLLLEYWLIPYSDDNTWKTKLSHNALLMTGTFWDRSIRIDEKSVIDELDSTLYVLLNSLDLGSNKLPEVQSTKTRYNKYYTDICNLHNKMSNIFPKTLTKARLWNKFADLKPLEDVIVYCDDSLQLEVWQHEIINKLQTAQDNNFSITYKQIFSSHSVTLHKDIKHLQSTLFLDKKIQDIPKITNFQLLVARDVQQEVEVLAGMVQNIHKDNGKFEEMAIIIPRDGWYKEFLIQTFNTFHIPLSRVGQVEEYSDIGSQWIFDAIQAQSIFAPPMIFAALLSSPIMPYSYAKGQSLAQIALSNAWRDSKGILKENLFNKLSKNAQVIIKIVIKWQEQKKEIPVNNFLNELEELKGLFSSSENIRLHKQRFKLLLEDLNRYYEKFSTTDFKSLLNQVQPYSLQESSARESFLNSIHVVYEDEYMIQDINHLFVLGFNNGRYPRKLENVGVFSRNNWQLLSTELNLPLLPQQRFYENEKATFKRQLQCAKESITFLSSALDLQGTSLTPSSSLSDIAFCFYDRKGDLEPEELLIYLEKETVRPFFFATNDNITIKEHRELKSDDLKFNQNLFELRKNKDGTLRPESPSSFEKIIISPLAWFLYRQGLESKTWDVEELSAAIQGTIAHGVFEDIFCPANPTNNLSNINDYIEKRIDKEALFLKQDHKCLEYNQLKTGIIKSAEEFKALLTHCSATVKSTEEQLIGNLGIVPVAGRTDAILNIVGKQLVLDYKNSASKGRISRMMSGYDHQLFLYKIMLGDDTALTAYYTMKDATLVVDDDIGITDTPPFKIVSILDDCTVNAQQLIKERIEELGQGIIKLNTFEDDSIWDKRGITASYSLEGSPLITLYMKEDM